jgi:hypothetical protein
MVADEVKVDLIIVGNRHARCAAQLKRAERHRPQAECFVLIINTNE